MIAPTLRRFSISNHLREFAEDALKPEDLTMKFEQLPVFGNRELVNGWAGGRVTVSRDS